MAIRPKNKATIVSKDLFHYVEGTFDEHEKPFFIETTAEQVLEQIQPVEFDFLPGEKFIAIDTETYAYPRISNNSLPGNVVRRWIDKDSKLIPNDFPFCISLSDSKHSFVVYDTIENQFAELKKLEPLLLDRSISKVGHNLDFDLHILKNAKVNLRGPIYDTMHLSKLTRADAFTHRLLDIAVEIENQNKLSPHYAPTVAVFEHMLDSYKAEHKITNYRMFPRKLMTQYTCADTWNAIWVFKELYPRMLENDQKDLYDIERQILWVCFQMERTGILLNPDYKDTLINGLTDEVNEAERKIYATAGTIFNINSGAQLERVLIDMGYGNLIKYKKPTEAMLAKGIVVGNACFDKYEMERLDNEGVPLISDIQQYRKSEKLLNTFAIKLYELCDFNNVVHCNINTIEAKTGRFSISVPSMQNMPRRKDDRVRGAFIAPEDYTLYDFDFKSQESIILVHYSRSQYLMDIINDPKRGDIHTAVASIIYSLPYEGVSKDLRGTAKSVEFAIVYGAGASKVANMTGLSMQEATVAMKTFLHNAPEIDSFIKTANKVAKERGVMKSIMHRLVYIEHGREYACVNYVIQSSAADSTKTKMVQIYKFLKANHYKSQMILQVHDSLLDMVHKDEESFLPGYLCWLQTEFDLFRLPVLVDAACCKPTWKDKKDVDIDSVRPPEDQLEIMRNYDIWSETLL